MSRGGKPAGPALAEDGPWLDPQEVEPALFLFAPADLAGAGVMDGLAAALGAGAVALVVDAAALPEASRGELLAACRAVCTGAEAAFLLLDDAEAARRARATGVHLSAPDEGRIAAARRVLGAEAIIGAACGLSRHAAMVAGEAGADYVMFGTADDVPVPGSELGELVAWWSELFVLPCAAAGRFTPELAAVFARTGADLLALRYDWLQPAAEHARTLVEAARRARDPRLSG